MQEIAKTPPDIGNRKEDWISDISPKTRMFLEEMVNKTMDYSRDMVELAVWELTYFSEGSIFVQMSEEKLTQEQIEDIRKEILRRYRLKNPWWSFGKKYPKKSKYKKLDSFQALKEAVKGDEVTIHIVMDVIEYYLSRKKLSREKAEKTITNLRSERERKQFGGLRMLGFEYEEADFLRPCANAIGDLIKDLYQR